MKKSKGFTLLELLVVMGILTMLLSLTLVTIDPVTRFAQARNGTRLNDVNALLVAIHEFIVDNDGALPPGINTTEKQLGTCSSGGNSPCSAAAASCLDLTVTLARYIPKIPTDPGSGIPSTTHYSVLSDANNIVTVKACAAELGETIQVAR